MECGKNIVEVLCYGYISIIHNIINILSIFRCEWIWWYADVCFFATGVLSFHRLASNCKSELGVLSLEAGISFPATVRNGVRKLCAARQEGKPRACADVSKNKYGEITSRA